MKTYRVKDILAVYQQHADYGDITIEYPLDGTLFPPEMIPPVFRWKDSVPASRAWLVRIEFADGSPLVHFPVRRQNWKSRPEDWDNIKHNSLEQETQVVILGIDPREPARVLSRGRMSFRTSKDRVEAPLFYREVALPFVEANKDLPGANNPEFVQSNPTWSPDGEYIVFARTKAPDLRNTKHQGYVWLTPAECREFVTEDEPFQFDL